MLNDLLVVGVADDRIRCDSKHSPDYCRFRDATCHFCQKTGHISAVCLKRKGTKGTYKVDRDEHNDDTNSITSGDNVSVHKLFHITRKKKIDPLVGINDRWVRMEIDTGATVSLISRTVFDRYWQGPHKSKLSRMVQKLVTYTGENITPCCTCEVTVTYDNQQYPLLLIVVPRSGPTLLGRSWLEVIQLSWNKIHQLKAVNITSGVNDIIQRYPDVF